MKLLFQIYDASFGTFYSLSSTRMMLATPKISQLLACLDMKASFRSSILLLQRFMLPVI
jgi:hypothetical protein